MTLATSEKHSLLISFVSIRVALALLWITALAGCETATGTRKEMNVGALSKIENLAVQVSVDKDFSVMLAGQKVNGIDFLLLSVALAGGLEARIAASAAESGNARRKGVEDARRAQEMRELIAEINLQNLARKTLVDGMQSTPRFKSVTAVNEDASPATGAGIFRVRIESWGLYSDKSEDRNLQQVQVGLNATASLFGSDGKLVWEHKDYFTGGAQHSFNQYRDSPDLLKHEIKDMVQRYCFRIVNEIRYAR